MALLPLRSEVKPCIGGAERDPLQSLPGSEGRPILPRPCGALVILILDPNLNAEQRERFDELAREAGLDFEVIGEARGRRYVLASTQSSEPKPDLLARIRVWPGVLGVVPNTEPFPRAAAAPTTVRIAPRSGSDRWAAFEFGPEQLVWIAGPCAVDDVASLGETAKACAAAGVTMLRAGAYKPRTSPYSFQGPGRDGLVLLATVARDCGLPLVTEVLDPRDVDFVAQHADLIQLGARSMQNFPLLREVGAASRPVLLKRGPSATIDEWLGAAEYVLEAGSPGVVLCERGVRGFDSSRRNLLDLSVVPALRERTGMPVVVDPSHGTGRRALVAPMARAAVSAGADGVMVEVHSRPEAALSDSGQALLPAELEPLGTALRKLAEFEGRRVPKSPASSWNPSAPGNEPVRSRQLVDPER